MKTPNTKILYANFVAHLVAKTMTTRQSELQEISKHWWMGSRLLSNRKSEEKTRSGMRPKHFLDIL